MSATIMPSVAHDIGGYAWFGWAVASFLLGSILGGATAGRLSVRVGLRSALASAAAPTPSAASPAPSRFDRLVPARAAAAGPGRRWVVGLCYVAVTALFPQTLWARVFSALSGVWAWRP